MKLIDLTQDITEGVTTSLVPIAMPDRTYQGVIHTFALSSMAGTYLDLPAHIREFDDGLDMAGYPLDKLWMVPATFIRLRRKGLDTEISAAELEAAKIPVKGQALIVDSGWNAVSIRNPQALDRYFYGKDAIQWIVDRGIHLFISDVYECHPQPRGIFIEFFRAGIATVCEPAGLDQLTQPYLKVCAMPLKVRGAAQSSCRVLAIEQ